MCSCISMSFWKFKIYNESFLGKYLKAGFSQKISGSKTEISFAYQCPNEFAAVGSALKEDIKDCTKLGS